MNKPLLLCIAALAMLSLAACGGGNSGGGNPPSQNYATKTADYQGYYTGILDYNLAGYQASGVQTEFDIDTFGSISNIYINHSAAATNDAKVISANGVQNNGVISGNVTFVDATRGQVQASFMGTVTVDAQQNSTYDITYTYSGGINGTVRARGERSILSPTLSADLVTAPAGPKDKLTVSVGTKIRIYAVLCATQYPTENIFTPGYDSNGIPSVNLSDTLELSSDPVGSTASISGPVFIPDKVGTYVLTHTGVNGAGAPITKSITIIAN
jgi:hypothetical protein